MPYDTPHPRLRKSDPLVEHPLRPSRHRLPDNPIQRVWRRHCLFEAPRANNTSILRDDVLQVVFDFLAKERVRYGGNLRLASDVIPLVCGSWKRLSIPRTSLWRTFIIHQRCSTREVCDRLDLSGNQGLQVEFTRMRGVVNWGLHLSELRHLIRLAEIMCKHVGRFEEFTILRFDAEHTSTILRVFNKPAPSLKLISVKLGEEGVPYPDDQWLPEMALQIFDGSMPSLKDATIYDFPVSFAGIGHLLVLGLRIRSACTLDDLLAALRQNTLLESLTIDTDGLECTMDRSLVHLPRLRNFTVKGPQDDAIRILNSLVFPKRTNVSVQMWCLYPDDEEESVAEVYESSFKEHLRDARYVMFGIKENKKRQIVLVLISATKDAKVVVSWAIPEPPDDSDSRIIGPRTDMLDFANVRHLDIVTLPSRNVLESLLWENMLGLFPALQEIKVRAPLPPPVHPVPEEGLPPADPAPEEGPPIDSDNADETDLNPIGQYEPAMLRTIRELCYTLTMGAPDDSLGAEPGARKMLFPNIRNLAMLNKYLEHEEADELRELYEWWMEMRPSEGLARMSLIGPAN